MVIASYKAPWENLSDDHKKIAEDIDGILEDYSNGNSSIWSYAIIGTFGSGKTQLLYHLHKKSLENQLVPIFFLAEDLFNESIKSNKEKTQTPGDLFKTVKRKIESLKSAISEGDENTVFDTLDPHEKLRSDTPELLVSIIEKFKGKPVSKMKVVLLVDELEGQYSILQNNIKTNDRSPLRAFLDDTSYLKFLSFAPASVYELGGADRDRVTRMVLPPSDMKYIRRELLILTPHNLRV